MGYDVVLREKEILDGLTRSDVLDLFDMLDGSEGYPIELEAKKHECSAMGFISTRAAEFFEYEYEKSGLHDFVAAIMDDMNNESETCEYEFRGIRIWLSRKE